MRRREGHVTWQLSDGDWCHIEIPMKDMKRLREFYEGVFGWKFVEFPGADELGYHLLGIQTSPDGINSSLGTFAQDKAVVPFVLVKGTIEDMKRRAAQIEAAGGSVVKVPTTIPGYGAYAYVADPEGHVFGLWQDAQEEASAGHVSS
jgi:predicted enzyme related to lactoylglutathione lyase